MGRINRILDAIKDVESKVEHKPAYMSFVFAR